jgi:hypothetical protein
LVKRVQQIAAEKQVTPGRDAQSPHVRLAQVNQAGPAAAHPVLRGGAAADTSFSL